MSGWLRGLFGCGVVIDLLRAVDGWSVRFFGS